MLGDEQFVYNDLLAELCGPDTPRLPAWRERLYKATSQLKRLRPEDYRDAAEAGGPGPGPRNEALAQVLAEMEAAAAEARAEVPGALAALGAPGQGGVGGLLREAQLQAGAHDRGAASAEPLRGVAVGSSARL
jgi:hypothetical protein